MVSVLMAVYKEPESFVRQAIESILHQTLSDLELIVIVDDPTNGRMIEILEEYVLSDPRLKYFINEMNKGLVFSLNRAIKESKGEFLARMDADDYSLKTRLEDELDYLVKNKFDLVSGVSQYMDEKGELINRTSLTVSRPSIERVLRIMPFLVHPTWLGRRRVFETLEGYRDIDSCEDYDFLIRALNQGFTIGQLPQIVLKYRINYAGISRTKAFKQYLSSKYIQKNNKRIESIDVEEIKRAIKEEMTEKNEKSYNQSIASIDNALQSRRDSFVHCLFVLVREFLCSRYGREKICRTIKEKIVLKLAKVV